MNLDIALLDLVVTVERHDDEYLSVTLRDRHGYETRWNNAEPDASGNVGDGAPEIEPGDDETKLKGERGLCRRRLDFWGPKS